MKNIIIAFIFLCSFSRPLFAQCELMVLLSENTYYGCLPLHKVVSVSWTQGTGANTVNATWNFGNGTIKNYTGLDTISQLSASTIFTNTGVYNGTVTMVLTATNSTCNGTATFVTSVVTNPAYTCQVVGIHEYDDLGLVSIFPNPTTGNFNLQIDKMSGDASAILENCYGQKVYETKVFQGLNPIQIQSIAKGLYILMITENDQRVIKRKVLIE